MKTKLLKLLLVFCAFAVTGCAKVAVVSEKSPASFPLTSGANVIVAQEISRGQKIERSEPLIALGAYVSAALESLRVLDRKPTSIEASRAYNFAVARIFTVVREAKFDPWTQPLS